jgi:hypothetical protein
MFRRLMVVLGGLLLFGIAFAPRSQADEWNEKTIFTFSQPVEVPGMILPPGTYVFKLMDSLSDRDVVQIFNKDQTKLLATILAIPDYRMNPTSTPIVKFNERPANAPEAIDAWFYPGDNYGMEFVYPKERATILAKANNRPVLAHEASPQAKPNELKTTRVKAVNPAGQEVEMAKVITPPTPAPTAAATPAPKMPHTASDLPLLAIIGLLLLGSGFVLPRISQIVGLRNRWAQREDGH